MTKVQQHQLAILKLQAEAMFKHYDASAKQRWEMADYSNQVIDGINQISYQVVVSDDNAKRLLSIVVNIGPEEPVVTFKRNYNYGVALDTHIDVDKPENNLINIEYALSLATEHLAKQLALRV